MKEIKCECGKFLAKIKAKKVRIKKGEEIPSDGRSFEIKCPKCKKLTLGIIE